MTTREELAAIQRGVPSARGTELHALLQAERELLDAHEASLLGPLAALHRSHPDAFGWEEGWIGSLEVPREGENGTNPRRLIESAREAGVLANCRALGSRRAPLHLPPSTTELSVGQAVITERLLAHVPLETLRVANVVASAPLRHATLSRLVTSCVGPVPELLESADLPNLVDLQLAGIGRASTSATHLSAVLASIPARRLALEIVGRAGSTGWTSADVTALAPVADRIFGLGLHAPFLPVDVPLPNLRRLALHTRSPVAFPDAPACDDLVLVTLGAVNRARFTDLPDQLARTLRALHWEFSSADPLLLVGRNFEALEELALFPGDTRNGVPVANEVLERGTFPRLRTVSLFAPQQIPALAASPFASQVEVLSAPMLGGAWLEAWTEARRHFRSLRTLHARHWGALSIAERTTLTEAGHDVHWTRRKRIARRPDFDLERGAPGEAGLL